MATTTHEIWSEFSDRLKRFIRKRVRHEPDADDILQDVFCKVHHRIAQLKDAEKLQAWVYQVTRHAIIDYYRRQHAAGESVEIPEDLAHEPSSASISDELVSCLKPMMDQLPEKYRQALTLTDLQGLRQKELAEKLGISLSGAKSQVQRAREKLKDMLLACCHFEFDRRGQILDYQPKEQTCRYCHGESPGK